MSQRTTSRSTSSPTRPCLLTSRPPLGTITRYAAGGPGAMWWVGYTSLENACDTSATLTGLVPAGSQPGSSLEWTTRTAVQVLAEGAIPDAFLPIKSLSSMSLEGYVIKPGQRVEIMAQIRIAGTKNASQRVPALRLGLTDPGGPGHVTLAPDIRLCTCNLPS